MTTSPPPRLLFLTQVLPYPLDSGPKIRAYHVLRWLAERFELHLLTFLREDDPPEALAHLAAICASVTPVPLRRSRARDVASLASALVTDRSFIVERDERREMREALAELQAETAFDAVHADQLWMARYAREVPAALRVLDMHNAVYRVFERLGRQDPHAARRWLWAREAPRIARYEAAQAECFDGLLFVTEEDRCAVIDAASDAQAERLRERSHVVPICVDASAIEPVTTDENATRLTLIGTMYWPPNDEGALWFADQVLPRVLEAVPGARFTVIGKRPSAALRARADAFGDAMVVTGYVPELEPYLRETAVMVVPLLSGAGMRVKILDAWAWGLPVVSTTMGAEGLAYEDGVDLRLADEPASFARALVDLLRDPAARATLGAGGRRRLESTYDLRRVYDALASCYDLPVSTKAREGAA